MGVLGYKARVEKVEGTEKLNADVREKIDSLSDKEPAYSENKATDISKAKLERFMILGDIGGGTRYFHENAMRGIYRMLKERKPEEMPDYLIINGGLLPEIPNYATKASADKLHVLEKGINNIDEAIVSVRPSMKRILLVLEEKGSKTRVHYVLGAEDRVNIKSRNYDRLIKAYNNDPALLNKLKNVYIKKIHENENNINEMQASQNVEKNLIDKTATDQARTLHTTRANKLGLDIKQKTEQTNDYKALVQLYEELQISWIRETPNDSNMKVNKIKEIFGDNDGQNKRIHTENEKKLAMEYSELAKKLRECNEAEQPEEYRKLESKVKRVANLIDAMGYKRIIDTKSYADLHFKSNDVLEKGEIFTHNLRASHAVEELARRIANMEMLTHIKDAFGRKYPVEIATQDFSEFSEDNDPLKYNLIRTGNSNVLIMNTPTNTSGLFPTNPLAKVKDSLNTVEARNQPINIVIAGRSIEARVRAEPIVDNGKGTFIVLAPPMVNVNNVESLQRAGVKTSYTMAFEKSKRDMASGVWEIELQGPKNKFIYYLSSDLAELAGKEHKEQRDIFAGKLRGSLSTIDSMPKGATKKLINEVTMIDRIHLKHKMPSEWNDALLPEFLARNGISQPDNGTITELAEAITGGKASSPTVIAAMNTINAMLPINGDVPKLETRLTVDGISDVHIGNTGRGFWSPQALLEANMQRIVKDLSDVIIFNGDIIDTNYMNYPFENEQETDYRKNMPEFKEFIKGKVPESKAKSVLDRYVVSTNKQVYNVSDQVNIFVDAVVPALEKLPPKRRPKGWVTSGNHHNKAFSKRDDDESTKIYGNLRHYINMVTVPGGDYGIGKASANGLQFMLGHHIPDNVIASLRLGDEITGVFRSHVHYFDMLIKGSKLIATIPAAAYINKYPTQIGIPTSEDLRGFSRYKILLRGDKVAGYSSEFISADLLEAEGYLRTDKADSLVREFNRHLNSPMTDSDKILA